MGENWRRKLIKLICRIFGHKHSPKIWCHNDIWYTVCQRCRTVVEVDGKG